MGLVQEMTREVQPLIKVSRPAGNPEKLEAFRLKIIKLRLDCPDKMEACMGDAQKKRWQEMTGKPSDTLRYH